MSACVSFAQPSCMQKMSGAAAGPFGHKLFEAGCECIRSSRCRCAMFAQSALGVGCVFSDILEKLVSFFSHPAMGFAF